MLEIRDLSLDYGGIQALNNVSLDVQDGVVTALIGSNGAGKSSLLRAISGLVSPNAGSIRFHDRELTKLSPTAIVEAGVVQVPEGRQLFPKMTVQENILLGAFLRRDRAGIKRDLDNVLDLFPVLRRRLTAQARQLSGGEQQMLAFARAMMARPRFFLLDEPSVGLSPLMEEHLMSAIVDICKVTGSGVLLVEQNATIALEISVNAYVMELGNLVLSGLSRDLLANPSVAKAYLGMGAETSPLPKDGLVGGGEQELPAVAGRA
jgi:branched-chain amino acid transport system ATP-binding protein